jgi:hypothetical protein
MGMKDALLYALSLPERLLRSTSAAVGGVSKIMTDTLLPASVRDLTFYRYFVGNTQRLLIESLGDVKTGAAAEKLPDDYIARKIVGNVADAAGIFAFHFSPVWFFALVGDAATGTKGYLGRIVAELEKDGAIAPGTKIESVDRLLEALTAASVKSAAPMDAPPLSKAELAALAGDIGGAYAELYRSAKGTLPAPDALWDGFVGLARREKLPLLQMSGGMALAATKAAAQATGGLFYEKVLVSYAASLSEVRARGFAPFFADASTPYVEAVTGAFSLSKTSFTERWLGKASTGESRPAPPAPPPAAPASP